MTEEPCPFCGSVEIEIQRHTDGYCMHFVRCLSCQATGPVHMMSVIAVVRWNRWVENALKLAGSATEENSKGDSDAG